MKHQKNNIEIMAPVGSYESLMAAIQGGADSVYFGVEQLNMRSKSSVNFTLNDLRKIVSIAKENQLKTYLTVNTVVFDHELETMRSIVNAAKENKVTAIIASDQAVIAYANSIGVEVHISTQLNISNVEVVKFYSKFADVMVLARELNTRQMANITQTIEQEQIKGPSGNLVQIEVFAHGALCMATSGKCYLSLHEYAHSANRGQCLQLCRRSYTVSDKETGAQFDIENEYIMSPKDLCTINFLDKLIEAGVQVLKIEGRARPPEYVKTVTACYKEAVNSYFEGTYTKEKIEIWMLKLSAIFNRGFWDGYYLGKKLGEWCNEYGSKATKIKQYIGKGQNYFGKLKVAEFKLEAGSLSVGDEILITGPTTGVIETSVSEIRLDLKNVEKAEKGSIISVPISEIVRRSDKLYKITNKE